MKIAVVGSGVSGLAATWLLNEHSEHEVHLYEAGDRPGGHANTVRFTPPGKTREDGVDVDTGFIVLNPSTYPNFLGFLTRLGVPILPTEMTFSVSRDGGMFEWAGNNLRTVFCQPSRLLDPAMWRLIYDLLRFNACARELVMDTDVGRTKKGDKEEEELSIGEYLTQEGYSQSFRDNYLIPMTAAIWSTPPDKCAMDFPARTLIQFMHNHHLLQVTGKPSWLTIQGGSQKYVSAILAKLPKSQLHLSTPVISLSNVKDGPMTFVDLTTAAGTEMYDRVILACHSDAALRILRANGNPTQEQEEILGRFEWNRNEAVLHADTRLMPKSRLAWSCWNYLTRSVRDAEGRVKANCDEVALTYGMNDLQHIPESKYGPVLVTLNPPFEPEASTVVGRYKYDHPVLNAQAVRAQREMARIQGAGGVWYAGAYLRYGFHEDGFTSGVEAAAAAAGVVPPFGIKYAESTPGRMAVAQVFWWLENTGARALVGVLGGVLLGVVRYALGWVVDLRHLSKSG